MTTLNEDQINKFRAIGSAAKRLGDQYSKGEGPNPASGSTYCNGVPMCTWGQLLHEAGLKTTGGTSSNISALEGFIFGNGLHGNGKFVHANAVEEVKDGLFVDSKKTYNIEAIKKAANDIMNANDPAPTPEARKRATAPLLLKLADSIEKEFGEQSQEDSMYFATAAEQYLEQLIHSEE